MSRIPKILHFCFGLSANFGRKPWSMVHYVCVKSAVERIKPDRAVLYYEFEPSGPWWELTKPLLERVKVHAPREVFGQPLERVQHRADVFRLQRLIEHGGIYLDCDIFVHRDFDDLLNHSFVISEEGENAQNGLSNAVLLAEPAASFGKRWYDEYRSFRGDHGEHWVDHSIKLPHRLAQQFPEEVTILPHTAFCWPLYYDDHLRWIFEAGQPPFTHDAYATHFWETISWEKYLENLTSRNVRSTRSNFSAWVSPLIADLPDDFGSPSWREKIHATGYRLTRQIKRRVFGALR